MTIVKKAYDLSESDLQSLGMLDMAYVKWVDVSGVEGYGIFSADGTCIGVAPDRDVAVAAIHDHGMEHASIH